MSVNLQKGQKVDLTKGNASLKTIVVRLGWDAVPVKKGGLFAPKPQPIDCDASALVCGAGGKLSGNNNIVYFGNLKHSSGSVIHTGDNLTGDGDGDDEQIIVQLANVPQNYEKIVFVVNIYQAVQRKQHFGMIQNCFIRIFDADTKKELCKYVLSENYDNMTTMIPGEVYRNNVEWKFNALGQATTDPGLGEVVKRYL